MVTGGGIATSSLMYLALPIVMGLLLRYTKLSLGLGDGHLPAAGRAGDLGRAATCPFDVAADLFGVTAPGRARKVWDVVLLVYCLVAAVVPRVAAAAAARPPGRLLPVRRAWPAGMLGIWLFGGQRRSSIPAFRGLGSCAVTGGDRSFPHAVHHHRLRRLLRLSFADRLRHDVQAAAPRNRRQARSATARCCWKRMVAIVSLCCVMMFAARIRRCN